MGGGGGDQNYINEANDEISLSLFFTVTCTILRNRASIPAAYLIGVLKNDNSRLNRNWFIWKATTDTHTNRSPAQRINSRNIFYYLASLYINIVLKILCMYKLYS